MFTIPASDFYQLASPSAKFNVEAGTASTITGSSWLLGSTITDILTRITADAPASPGSPTLVFSGRNIFEWLNGSGADLFIECAICSFNFTVPRAATLISANYTGAWDYSYASRETGFEEFPTTHLRSNWAFFKPKYFGVRMLKYYKFKVPAAKRRTLTVKHKPTTLSWLDYKQVEDNGPNTYIGFKSQFIVFRAKFEQNIICGATTNTDPAPPVGGNWPISGPVGGDLMFKNTQFYRYNWVPGNTAPHQKGSWLSQYGPSAGGTETVPSGGLLYGWVRDGVNKHFRYVKTAGLSSSSDYRTWGPQAADSFEQPFNVYSAVSATPVKDCTGANIRELVLQQSG